MLSIFMDHNTCSSHEVVFSSILCLNERKEKHFFIFLNISVYLSLYFFNGHKRCFL